LGEEAMPEMMAYCGLRCDECKILKVTQARDYEQKKQTAKRWSDQFEIKFKPEDVTCEGCKSDVLSGWCRSICKMRPCAEERNVETCAHCDNYPCDVLKKFLSEEPVAKENLETIRRTLRF
jgi:hypothetical protein